MVSKIAEEISYLVPEINVTITQAWVALISYCQDSFPYGDLFLEISNGQPGKKTKEVPSIRFDKPTSHPKDGLTYLIPSLEMRIPKSWIDMIQWCQQNLTSGKIGFRVVNAQPTELLQVSQLVNFSKPETIPCGIPLNFSRE
jgi:hypothetical protein